MKIYCLRDRLIDYYMVPFAAPGAKEVMQSLSTTINAQTENMNGIAQAPHHYELFQLGYLTEDGHLVAEREFICDLATLVRRDIRNGGEPRGAAAEIAPESRRGPLGGPESRTGAGN